MKMHIPRRLLCAIGRPGGPQRAACLALLALAAILAGCGPSSNSPAPGGGAASPPKAGGRLFGVTFQTMNNPFFVDLNEGLKKVVDGRGDRLVTLDAQFNSLKQKNDISDLLQQNPAAI